MAKFEVVSKYWGNDEQNLIPKRKTKYSAGYDFVVAEDTVVPSLGYHWENIYYDFVTAQELIDNVSLAFMADVTKRLKAKPTLVPTGIKCKMEPDTSLELYVRSSAPLKNWLVLANGVGIVDADYYNNPDNEGEIFFQVINLSPVNIILHKGDTIGQGIIRKYEVTEDDIAEGERISGFGSTGANFV